MKAPDDYGAGGFKLYEPPKPELFFSDGSVLLVAPLERLTLDQAGLTIHNAAGGWTFYPWHRISHIRQPATISTEGV